MQINTDYRNIKNQYPHLMVAMGNFDGVHIGHQELIRTLVKRCQETRCISAVLTFNPHPTAVLQPRQAPPLLLSSEAKEELVARLGVELYISIPFDLAFAALKPEDFVQRILVCEMGVKGVFVGYNFTFGNRGSGNAATLGALGAQMGFEVHITPPVTVSGQVVSSTLIRKLVASGQVDVAASYLGHPFFIEGVVVSGERRGRKLGFPTANIEAQPGILLPQDGVYAVRVLVEEETYLGVANIGLRPTFYGQSNTKRSIEVHLLDFTGDLYGLDMKLMFRERLRGERGFSSIQELTNQINADILRARGVHGK